MLAIPLLPRSLVTLLASLLGRTAYFLARRDRAVAAENIRMAFGGDVPDEDILRITRESFEGFALVLLDLFWFSFMTERRVARYVHFDSEYDWTFGDRPFVYLTAHFGNWEVLGLGTALRAGGILSVAAPLENKVADRILKGMRRGTGQAIISKHGAVRALMKELKENGKVALVMDQNTLPKDGGLFVDLFGVPAPVSMAASSLILHSGCDAAFVCGIPDGRGHYDARLVDKIPASESQVLSREELTRRIAAALEKAVRAYPGKWLWSYKRWKFIPEGGDVSKFPSYSRPA